MRFEDYAALARSALAKDAKGVSDSVRIAAALEEKAGKAKNAALLNDLLTRHGGTRVLSDLPMIRQLSPRFLLGDLVLPEKALEVAEGVRLEREKRGLLEKHGLEPRSRLLLRGKPGTGKTAYAHALAARLDLPLFSVAWSQVIDQFLGVTGKLVDRMLDWAAGTDCVLLLDEVDIILRERDDRHEIGEIKRIVCNLLPKLESMGSRAVIVAATNHPQCLDSAVWRRFQEIIDFPDATAAARMDLMRRFRLKHDVPEKGMEKLDLRLYEPDLNFGEFERLLENALRRSLVCGENFFETLAKGGEN